MLGYVFMQKALLVGFLVSLAIPLVGQVLVLRKYSMLGDALSHGALAGVCFGLIVGINPTIAATIIAVFLSFAVTVVGRKMRENSEIAIAIIMSLGVGIAGILSGFIDSSVSITSFLFGSIVAISQGEFYTVVVLSLLVIGLCYIFYYQFMFYSFNELEAGRNGVNVKAINFLFTVMVGLTIAISARIVGALIISSLLVIPVACGLLLSKSYKSNMLTAMALSSLFTLGGITMSFYFDLRPGGTIVVFACLTLIAIMTFQHFQKNNR
ncbi:MAG: metal ABC transporter permease [Erysipelotrichaceae bacterium]|nr:metal ABC transporter permease [Erysipelotrichaceae bacterium]